MKICQFFIPILFVTISGHSLVALDMHPSLSNLFADPDAFVATLANADPEQIEPIIEMVEALISSNNKKKQKAQLDYDAKKRAYEEANDYFAGIFDNEAMLLGAIEDKNVEITSLDAEILKVKVKIKIASEMRNISKDNVEKSKNDQTWGVDRINNNKEIMLEMRNILESELPASIIPTRSEPGEEIEIGVTVRHLLANSIPSKSAHNLVGLRNKEKNEQKMEEYPESIDELLALVDEAIDEGISEKAELETNLDNAQKDLEMKEIVLNNSKSALENLKAKIGLIKDSIQDLELEEEEVKPSVDDASGAKDITASEFTIAEDNLRDVTASVDAQNETLEKVDVLLKEIVTSATF